MHWFPHHGHVDICHAVMSTVVEMPKPKGGILTLQVSSYWVLLFGLSLSESIVIDSDSQWQIPPKP